MPAIALTLLGACWQTTVTPPAPPTPAPTKPAPAKPSPPPVAVDPIVELASQSQHTCARRKSGTVLCWGNDSHGQLGNGARASSSRLVKVEGLQDAVELAVGRDFSCARRKAGSVACWGNNEFGQLGDGRGTKPGALSLRPVTVAGLRQPIQLSAGEFHVCALEQAGKVQCWGRNTEGELGDGKSGSRIKPVTVAGLDDVVDLVSGHRHSCARTRAGKVWCWGDNAKAQLGPAAGREAKRNTPVEVTGLANVAELAGGSDHTCARLQTGRVMCWGSNAAGQLGPRSTAARLPTPTAVRGMADAVDIALGAEHTCALRKTGEVACWGSNEHGSLGPYQLE